MSRTLARLFFRAVVAGVALCGLLPAADDPWVFGPLSGRELPSVLDEAWPRTGLDRFILRGLEEKGLRPARPASRLTLIRRVTFDLTGLPPAPGEIDDFLADDRPGAFSRLVDRLLASPRHGERWGRHWLDVARYADSNGLDENIAHGNAWRYRDYVVASFNEGKPHDVFLLEQLAGDLLPPDPDLDPELHRMRRHGRLIATGFLTLGPKVLAEGDVVKMEMDIIDEQIDTVGRSLMGLTLGCARCHDHKFDPIGTADYYALAGIFKSTRTMESFKRIARWHENSLALPEQLALRKAHDEKVAVMKRDIENAKKKTAGDGTKAEIEELEKKLAALERSAPVLPSAMGVAEGQASDVRISLRGNHLTPGDRVSRGLPAGFPGSGAITVGKQESGRLQLARWLCAGGKMVTGRIMANRIWRWHFGVGLVRTVDNFGRLGERPTNPELLDWLARSFIDTGWSLKAMHRLIVLSSAYRMSGAHDSTSAARVDPADSLLWHFPRRRLEAEELRDAILAVSGLLDLRVGGSLLKVKNRAFIFDHTSKDATSYDSRRRSIYLPVVRNHLHDVFQLFDFPDPSVLSGDRTSTVVPSQALFLMNGELLARASEQLARDLLAGRDGPKDDAARIHRLYRLSYGRPPDRQEVERALGYVVEFRHALESHGRDCAVARLEAWATLCQTLVSSNEFLHVE